jgi:hypothetical protein
VAIASGDVLFMEERPMRLALILTLLAAPAFADGGITVKLPPDDAIQGVASRDLLAELVQANVTGMNCPDFMLTDGERTLITGSGYRHKRL